MTPMMDVQITNPFPLFHAWIDMEQYQEPAAAATARYHLPLIEEIKLIASISCFMGHFVA